MFITFEGGEGAGKTIQIKKLAEFLKAQGKNVVTTREPGGSEGAEAIRELLVKGDSDKWDNITEVLLFFASRRDHVEKTIKPALARGDWVISDRFSDSTIAYQLYGYKADNITRESLDEIYKFTLGNFQPNITFILDIPPEIGIERKKKQDDEFARFEQKNIDFHNNLRDGYLKLAQENLQRYQVIDAKQSIEEIHDDIVRRISLCMA